MSTTPIHDELTLQALDWDHEVPCEAKACHPREAHAAACFTTMSCCGKVTFRCQENLNRVLAHDRGWLPCSACGHPWDWGVRFTSIATITFINK